MDELTDGRGADLAVDAAGSENSLRLAVAAVRKGAAICQIGNLAPEVMLPLQTLVTAELTLYGATTARHEEEHASLAMLADGAIDTTSLVSSIAPLSEGADWFTRLRSRERGLLKVILTPR